MSGRPPFKTLTVDTAALEKMTTKELRSLQESLRTIFSVAWGVSCVPTNVRGDGFTNAAGKLLDTIGEYLSDLHDAVVATAMERQPETAEDVEHRAWCILRAKAEWADELDDIAAIAAMEHRRHVDAKRRENKR